MAGFWSRERDSCGVLHCARWGPAPPPPWGKRLEWFCTSLQNHSHLHLIFFSPAGTKGCSEASTEQALAESTLQWALGGQWDPHSCCWLLPGLRRDPGIRAARQDPGEGSGEQLKQSSSVPEPAPITSCSIYMSPTGSTSLSHLHDHGLWLTVPLGLGSWCSKKQFCKKCKFGCWTLNTTGIGPSWCI